MALFDYSNPAYNAMPFLNQIPAATAPYYQPFVQAGQQAIPALQGQYNDLMTNPGGRLNQIGGSYQQSPGLQFAIQQALQGAGHAAAAGGMAGSPQHEFENMGLATNLANQDYYNWLGQATGLLGQGLAGEQGLYNGGVQAGGNLADIIGQTLAQQGQMAFLGQQNNNMANASKTGALTNLASQGLGALSAFLPYKEISSGIANLLGLGGKQ